MKLQPVLTRPERHRPLEIPDHSPDARRKDPPNPNDDRDNFISNAGDKAIRSLIHWYPLNLLSRIPEIRSLLLSYFPGMRGVLELGEGIQKELTKGR